MDKSEKEHALIKISRSVKRFIDNIITEIELRFYRYNKKPNKKILAYWNFNKRGETIGDFIVFLEILSVMRLRFNLHQNKKEIDFCFIDDKKEYHPKNVFLSKTYTWKKKLKALTVFNPYIDSVFYFNSILEFKRFYAQHKKRYIKWPNEIVSNICDARIIDSFYIEKKILPKLNFPIEIISKIYEFYESNIYPALPVIFNIRNNTRSKERNSNLMEIKKFLKKYEKDKTYTFIIICEKAEIPKDFRKLNNVVFSKDYFNELEFDAGLITTSYLSIFPSSGMSMFAWFTDTPFIHYGDHYGNPPHYNPSIPPKGKKFSFFSKYQRHYHKKETAKWLISEFEDLIKYLRKNKINNNLKNKIKDNKKYLAEF